MTLAPEAGVFDEKEWEVLVEELALSPQQSQIIHHLFKGKSDKQIAHDMGLAVPTVRTHLGRLFTKLSVRDRTELVIHVFHYFRTASKANKPPSSITAS